MPLKRLRALQLVWVALWAAPGAILYGGVLLAAPNGLFSVRIDPAMPHIGLGVAWPALVVALTLLAATTGPLAPARLLVPLARAWRSALPFVWVAPAVAGLALLPSASGVIGAPVVVLAMGAAAGARGSVGAAWAEGWEIAWRAAVYAVAVAALGSVLGLAFGLVLGWPAAATVVLADRGVVAEGWLVDLAVAASGAAFTGGLVTVLSSMLLGFSLSPGHASELLRRLRAARPPV